jgi:hypothetical protein
VLSASGGSARTTSRGVAHHDLVAAAVVAAAVAQAGGRHDRVIVRRGRIYDVGSGGAAPLITDRPLRF